jgi:hypothetical protein
MPSSQHEFLSGVLADARSKGHEWVQLVRFRNGGNSPRNWDRCRVINGRPSLMGRCIGSGMVLGSWRFDVRVDDLEAWLKAHTPLREENSNGCPP